MNCCDCCSHCVACLSLKPRVHDDTWTSHRCSAYLYRHVNVCHTCALYICDRLNVCRACTTYMYAYDAVSHVAFLAGTK